MFTDNFNDWYDNILCVEVESHFRKNNLPFRAVLLLDNVSTHGKHLVGRHPNIEVIFLPPNTTSLIQPMDQCVIASLKLKYLKKVKCSYVNFIDDNIGEKICSNSENLLIFSMQ